MLRALLRPVASVPDGTPAWGGREEMQVFPGGHLVGGGRALPPQRVLEGRENREVVIKEEATCGRYAQIAEGQRQQRDTQRQAENSETETQRQRQSEREKRLQGYQEQGQGGSSEAEANTFGERRGNQPEKPGPGGVGAADQRTGAQALLHGPLQPAVLHSRAAALLTRGFPRAVSARAAGGVRRPACPRSDRAV